MQINANKDSEKCSIKINDVEYIVKSNIPIIEACKIAKIEIPHFCYYKGLSISGNCRMCLVQVSSSAKLIASCANIVSNNMEVFTETEKVKKARQDVMEMLLINHPLDCPVCDEAGQCDLQDQAFYYGSNKSNFTYQKRATQFQYMGPLIKTHMNRCIHCSRCIRFSKEITEKQEIFAINRGEDTVVTTFSNPITSKLSGNLIDLCPVGALTSFQFAYTYRKWELNKIKSFDVMDTLCLDLDIFVRKPDNIKYNKITRILPHENLLQLWISDKARFAFDGLDFNRIDEFYIKKNNELISKSNQLISKSNQLITKNNDIELSKIEMQKMVKTTKEASINKAIELLKKYNKDEIAFLFGPLVDCETMLSYKILADHLGVKLLDTNTKELTISSYFIKHYKQFFKLELDKINEVTYVILIGVDLDVSAPVLNALLKNKQIINIQSFNSKKLYKNFKEASLKKNPLIILGEGLFFADRDNDLEMQNFIILFAKQFNLLSNLHIVLNEVASLSAIYLNMWKNKDSSSLSAIKDNKIKLLYAIGVDLDEVFSKLDNFSKKVNNIDNINFEIIHQASHFSELSKKCSLIIPTSAHYEKASTHFSLPGIKKTAPQIIDRKGAALDDYEVAILLAKKFNLSILAYDDIYNMQYFLNNYLANLDAEYIKSNNIIKIDLRDKAIFSENIIKIIKSIKNYSKTSDKEFSDKTIADEEYSDIEDEEYSDIEDEKYSDIEDEECNDIANEECNDIANEESNNKTNEEECNDKELKETALQQEYYISNLIAKNSPTMQKTQKTINEFILQNN